MFKLLNDLRHAVTSDRDIQGTPLVELRRIAKNLEDYLDLDKFQKYFEPKKSNIKRAVLNGFEIFIHGKCVLLNSKTFDANYLRDALF